MLGSLTAIAWYSVIVSVTMLFASAVVVKPEGSVFFTLFKSASSIVCLTSVNMSSFMSRKRALFTLLDVNWLNSTKSSPEAVTIDSLTSTILLVPVYSTSIFGFVVLFAIVSMPRPGLTLDTVPAFAVVLTVTAPVPPLRVTFPPALA